ncbi:MAG: hypothetical protein AAGI53_16220 [Planctomycetota bacterium]
MDSKWIFTVAALLAACGSAQSQIVSYVNGNGTNFNSGPNWSTGNAPNGTTHLAFVGNVDGVENFSVFLSADTILGGLTTSDGTRIDNDGVLNADGGTLSFPSWNGVDVDGSDNTASLVAKTGSQVVIAAFLAGCP